MMYKYSHNMLPQMIQYLYVTNNAVHHYVTRQSNLLHVPAPGVHTNNFRYKNILIWKIVYLRDIFLYSNFKI